MRTLALHRILVGLLTAVLIGLVPVAFTSSAEAARAKRDVSATAKDAGRTVRIVGKVAAGKSARMIVQKKLKGTKTWSLATKIHADKRGKYAYRVPLGKAGTTTCYRIIVPGGKSYKKAVLSKFTYGAAKGLKMCIVMRRI